MGMCVCVCARVCVHSHVCLCVCVCACVSQSILPFYALCPGSLHVFMAALCLNGLCLPQALWCPLLSGHRFQEEDTTLVTSCNPLCLQTPSHWMLELQQHKTTIFHFHVRKHVGSQSWKSWSLQSSRWKNFRVFISKKATQHIQEERNPRAVYNCGICICIQGGGAGVFLVANLTPFPCLQSRSAWVCQVQKLAPITKKNSVWIAHVPDILKQEGHNHKQGGKGRVPTSYTFRSESRSRRSGKDRGKLPIHNQERNRPVFIQWIDLFWKCTAGTIMVNYGILRIWNLCFKLAHSDRISLVKSPEGGNNLSRTRTICKEQRGC